MKTRKSVQSRKLTTPISVAPCQPLKRLNYFFGQLLSAADLQAEQNYLLGKHRRHNLRCHGAGIVEGLQVSVSANNAGASVIVAPGFAIDPMGNEVELCAEAQLNLPAMGKPVYVVISYHENLTDPIPVLGSPDTNPADAVVYTRTEEAADILILSEVVSPAIALARLVGRGKTWRLDSRFQPLRAKGVQAQ